MEKTGEGVCQICLNDIVALTSIHERAEKSEKTFAEMLIELTQVRIKKDQLPKNICKNCCTDAEYSLSFKEKVEHSLIKLCKGTDVDLDEQYEYQNVDKSTQTESIEQLNVFSISNHQTKINGNICPICNRTFSRKDHTKEHIVRFHKEDPKKYFDTYRGCEPKDLKCSICDKNFRRKHHVLRHIRLVHKQDPKSVSLDINQTLTNAEERYEGSDNHGQDFEKNPIGSDTEINDSFYINSNTEVFIKTEPSEQLNVSEEENQQFFKVEFTEGDLYGHEDNCFDEQSEDPDNGYNPKSQSSSDNDSEPLIKMKELITKELCGNNGDTKEQRTCQLCQRIFSRLCHLRRHMQSVHSQEKPHVCPHCEKCFSRADLLKNHIHGVHNRHTHKCELCEKAFTCEEAHLRHMQASHTPTTNISGKRQYGSGEGTAEERTCPHCERIFSRQSHLRRHIQSAHLQEKPHACVICEKRFSRSDLLKNHVRGVHEEKTLKCNKCEKVFSRKEALLRHQQTPHGRTSNMIFNCDMCERTFSEKRFLVRHQLLHSDRIFACRFCEETFKDRKLFNEHERGHKSDQKDFLCSICGESFRRIDYLRIHVQRHVGDKQNKCQYCEKSFIRKGDLKEHERYHTNTKPNVCKICGKGFVRRSKLTIHMRIHTGEKPYACDYCPKSFAQRNDLKAHIRRHTGERFRCDQCDASFLQLYGLRQHALNAHGKHIESSTGRLEKIQTACL